MDSSSLIIGIIILALFCLPFIIVRISNNKKVKNILAICSQHGIKIGEKECFEAKVLNLDKDSNKLLFINFAQSRDNDVLVNLADMKSCNVFGSAATNGPIGLRFNSKLNNDYTEIIIAEANSDLTTIECSYRLACDWAKKISPILR